MDPDHRAEATVLMRSLRVTRETASFVGTTVKPENHSPFSRLFQNRYINLFHLKHGLHDSL